MFKKMHPTAVIRNIILFPLFLFLLTTCDLFSPSLGDKIDTDSPVIGIESHGNGTYVGGTITLSGYASDDLEVKSVTVSSGSVTFNARLSGDSWSLDLDTTQFSDGDLELTVKAVDSSGKTVSTTVLLIVDNNPPAVLITSPTEYGSSSDSDFPEFNKGFTLKGETADATRVKKVYVSLYEADGTAVFEDGEASGTSSWYYTFNSELYSLSGDYFFFVEAEDYSGNRNSYYYHIEDIIDYAVDAGSLPSIEEINTADLNGTDLSSSLLTTSQENLRLGSDPAGTVMAVVFNPDSDLPQFDFVSPPIVESPDNPLEENRFSVPQRFTGYVEDDDASGIALVELAIFDYETDTPLDIYGEEVADSWISQQGSGLANESSDLTFSGTQWILDAELPEGTFYLVLRAEDASGASATSIEVPFTVSASAPSIVVNSPDPGTYIGVGRTISLDINVNKSDGTPWEGSDVYVDPDGDLSWTDGNAILMTSDVNEVGHFTLDLTEGMTSGFNFTADGSYTIRMRTGTATNAGNATLGITADITAPTMAITSPGDGDTLNGTVTIRGTADDVAIAAVYGKIEAGDIPEYTSYPADPLADGWDSITDSVYNWSKILDTTDYYTAAPGTLTLHYFAEDVAGNRGSSGLVDHPSRIMVTVDQDGDLPVINISQPSDGGRLGIDSSIIGNITDDDLVDVSSLMISLDGNAPVAVSSAPVSDSTNVSWSHSLVGVAEGVHTFELSVDDVKTNGDPVASSSLSYSFVVDAGPPSLNITVPAANSLWNEDVVISGTAVDVNGVKSMALSLDGTTWAPISITPTTDSTLINWSYTLPVDPDGSDDMQYTVQIRAVDQADATSTEYLPFEVDTTPPVLKITQPPESVTVNGDSVTVGGTVSDVNDVTGLYYYIDTDDVTPPADSASWTSIPIAYSWSFTFNTLDYNSTSTADDYKIWVRAVDHGDLLNETDDTADGHSLVITIDQETDRPDISFNDLDKSSTVASENVLVGATSLSGLIEDDDSINPGTDIPIEISIDGGAWTDVDLAPVLGGAAKQTIVWKHDISGLLEGVHHVKLRARDSESSDDSVFDNYSNFNWNLVENADLTGANTDADKDLGVPFIVNRGAPTIVISSPANYSYHNDDVIISGTAEDSNGVNKVEISFDNGANFDLFTDYSPAVSTASWSFTYDYSVLGSGVVSYIVQATDGYNSTSIAHGQFSVDVAPPSLIVGEPDASDTVNGTVSFYGTAGDDITLNRVYYSILPSGEAAPAIPVPGSNGAITSEGGYTEATGNYSWSDSFDTVSNPVFSSGDGSYVFRALAIDYAGNMSGVTAVAFTVSQESDRPEIDLSTFDNSGTFLTNVMPTSQQIIGTIVDDDSVQSGLLSIKVTNTADDTVVRDYTAVTSPPTTSETWKHTFTTKLPNGRYNLYVRGADENFIEATHTYTSDNFYWNEIGPIPFTVDEDLPVTSQTILDGELLNGSFSLSGTASDSNGIKSVDLVVKDDGGTEVINENLVTNADPFSFPSQAWSRSYPVNSDGSDDGTIEWTVTLTDAFDKTQSYTREAYIDTQAPHVTITSPNSGSTLNGSVLVEGYGNDGDTSASEVDGVWIWIGNGAVPAAGDGAWTLLSGTDDWEFRFAAAPYDGDTWGVYILTRDNFGNYSDPSAAGNNISITIDESENLPVITLSTAANSVLGASDLVEGTVEDDDYIDVSSLQISFDGGTIWTEVANKPTSNSSYVSFSHPVTALSAGTAAYEVRVKASDIGEDFLDDAQDIAPVTTTFPVMTDTPLPIYVDKALPDFSITQIGNGLTTAAETTSLYINDYITFSGTASDDVQVQSVQVKIGDGSYTAYSPAVDEDTGPEDSTNFNTWSWTVTSGLGLSDDTTINVLVTDHHNKTNEESYQLRVDTTDPTVIFATEATNPDTDYEEYGTFRGAYNGTYTFKGESNDNIKISKVYYLFDDTADSTTSDPAASWTEATGTYSWTAAFDTTGVADSADETDYYYLHVIATDGAGNFSTTKHLPFIVYQDTDKPIVSLSQPTAGEVMESNPRVLGTVRDDDGLTSVQISLNGGAYENVDSPSSVSGKSISFEHSLLDQSDGDYTIQIRAIDSGSVMTESNSVSFGINKLAPDLVLDQIEIVDIYGGAPKVYSSSGGTVSLNTTYINGDFTLVFSAADDNGIGSVQVDTGSGFNVAVNEGDDGSGADGIADNGIQDGDEVWTDTWLFTIASDGLGEGACNISYLATDSLGKTTEGLVTVILDTVRPVISFTSPASIPMSDSLDSPPYDSVNSVYYDAPHVNGDVTIQGTVSDDSSINDLVITGGIHGNLPLTNENSSPINWKVILDTAAIASNETTNYQSALAPDYTFNTGDDGASAWDGVEDGDETWTHLWRFPISVVATDAAGNKSQSYTDLDSNYVPVSYIGYIDIDPDGDLPNLAVVTPASDASVSGSFLVNGTITDDDGTDYVTLEFDLDDDGAWDDSGDSEGGVDLTLTNDLTTYNGIAAGITFTGSDINESTKIPLDAPSGSWSISLAASDFTTAKLAAAGYTNSGFIRMRFTPYDSNGLPGDAQIVRIYLDTVSPSFSVLSPATGTLQKGTVTLTTTISDDKQLDESNMLISYDGGANFSSIDSGDITGPSGTGPYTYDISIDIDTTDTGIVLGGNGLLDIQISVTDRTNKQSSTSVSYSVDNTLPKVAWNEDGDGTLLDLPFITGPVYTFKGNENTGESDDAYKVLGAAEDSGTISGIEKVNVYFVKDVSGTLYFMSPVDSETYTDLAVGSSYAVIDDDGDSGTAGVSIPFTENSNYIITIDNRIEQGTFDDQDLYPGIGDGDGFNESLKTKEGYDEWYSFFDTKELLDGPLNIYAVAYDEAGNMSYTVVDAQVMNEPPSVTSVEIDSAALNTDTMRTKVLGTISLDLNLQDATGIDESTLTMEIPNRYNIVSGTPDSIDSTWAVGSEKISWTSSDFTLTTPGTDSTSETATYSMDTTDYASGYYYQFYVEANDVDGNLVTETFYLWVNNDDAAAPSIYMDPFTQDSVAATAGHVELAPLSTYDGTDADLSGTVTAKGTTNDDSVVSSVSFQYSLDYTNDGNDANDTWVTSTTGTMVLTLTEEDEAAGKTYDWSYDWDTSEITGNAQANVFVRVTSFDGSNTGMLAAPVSVDIVPYITGITGAGFDSGLLTYVRRSVKGNYTVPIGATITITGYNLPGTTANAVTIGDHSGVVNTDYVQLTAEAGGTTTAISVDLAATSTSGEIRVTTNGVSSINNSNNDDDDSEANTYNPTLVDDRKIVFWNVSSLTGTSTVSDPYMAPNSGNTDFDWMYVKSGKELWLQPGGGTAEVLTKSIGLSGGAFNYNTSGNLIYLFNHDTEWSFYDGSFSFSGSVQFGQVASLGTYDYDTVGESKDEAYNWNQNTNFGKLGLGNINFFAKGENNVSENPIPYTGYSALDLNRYENLQIRSVGNSSLTRNYVAYFDTGADESRSIVFYSFQTSDTSGGTTASQNVYSNTALSTEAIAGGGFFANIDKFTNAGAGDSVSLTGTQKFNNMGIATPRGRQEVTTAQSGADSNQFDLEVYDTGATDPVDGYPIVYAYIAYFDDASQSLKITANQNAGRADPTSNLADTNKSADTWFTSGAIDSNAGAYVDMAIDDNGGIHLAYQDVASGYLKYARLTFNAGDNPSFTVRESVYVDALFGAGSQNSIVVKQFGTDDYRPVILSYSSAYTGTKAPLRLSYPTTASTDVTTNFGAGANSSTGAFTGDWETVALPAISNPVNSKSFLYLDASGNPQIGYTGSNLEESTYLGF